MARVFVENAAVTWSVTDDAIETSKLLISELATNAVKQTGRVVGTYRGLWMCPSLVRVGCTETQCTSMGWRTRSLPAPSSRRSRSRPCGAVARHGFERDNGSAVVSSYPNRARS
jgi:hypothetical protein